MPSKVLVGQKCSSEHIEFVDHDPECVSTETQVREEVEQTSTQGMEAPTKRQKKRDDERLDAAFQILTKVSASVTQKENNEIQIFGDLVVKKLNKYSLDLQTSVQQDIMNILLQADRTHANKISYISQNSTQYQSFISHTMHQPSHSANHDQVVQHLPTPSYSHSSNSVLMYDDVCTVCAIKVPRYGVEITHFIQMIRVPPHINMVMNEIRDK
ncbi:hypothetical protein FQR65_LT11095 [Abscondita terminalis]|nr:hypothetical protein FQR65_LT11095 [Abscondita terminalis]